MLSSFQIQTIYYVFVFFCRGHIEDVYDLCWSPDGNNLISGSVDNSAIIWDVMKGVHVFHKTIIAYCLKDDRLDFYCYESLQNMLTVILFCQVKSLSFLRITNIMSKVCAGIHSVNMW